VAEKCPADALTLAADVDAQDIVSLNLSRAIQLCVDIGAHLIASTMSEPVPTTMGQTFQRMGSAGILTTDLAERMQRAVGFRNIVIHSYEVIDWQMVHGLVHRHLTDFTAFATATVEWLDRGEHTPHPPLKNA
jgi:uncharacterized protein YutE (UPF0331/DUF86 family)